MFKSTKIIELGSCAFRQPNATSHCKFIHGYRLTAKFWFGSDQLDENNWVVDFGGLRGLKKLLTNQFDHTTCISNTDPKLDVFKTMRDAGVCDLRIMDGVGIEKFAEYCHTVADAYVDEYTDGRCKCIKVEVFEHENNSAIYEKVPSAQSGAEYMTTRADEIGAKKTTEEEAEDIATTVDNRQELNDLTKPPFKSKGRAAPLTNTKSSSWTGDSVIGL